MRRNCVFGTHRASATRNHSAAISSEYPATIRIDNRSPQHLDVATLSPTAFYVLPIELLDDSVALTGACFQFLAVHNPHSAAGVFNALLLLQNGGSVANRGPIRSQHNCEEIVSHGYQSGLDSVLGHEQPPCQALFNLVQSIAGNRLRNLHALHYSVARQYRLKLWG
jgi:hypothetical protein